MKMMYHRERPRCRQIILAFLKKFDCFLEGLLQRKDVYRSKLQKSQDHKMLMDGQFRTGLQIYQEQKKENIQRSMGMIK